MRRHLTFVQFGDYREAYTRLTSGGPENYVAQRYSVDFVTELAKSIAVSVVCLPAPLHDEPLPNGVRSIGLSFPKRGVALDLVRTLDRLDPTDVILATPNKAALGWALAKRRRVLPLLADSFNARRPRQVLSSHLVARLLSSTSIEVVANHNVPASIDLVRLGVPAQKVVPWDWPSQSSPRERSPKRAPPAGQPWTVMYVGMIAEAKGVGDAIEAMGILRARGVAIQLSIGGSGGEIEAMKAKVASLGVGDVVTFLGRIPNREVIAHMTRHDLVLVPSRHAYPEGLPMTIYEGLSSRSPLVVSDHPMFGRVLRHGETAIVFPEARPESLADALLALVRDPALYERLSARAEATWDAIQCPVKWDDLITRWLRNAPDDRAYFAEQSVGGRGLA